jgi:hypothetical protein
MGMPNNLSFIQFIIILIFSFFILVEFTRIGLIIKLMAHLMKLTDFRSFKLLMFLMMIYLDLEFSITCITMCHGLGILIIHHFINV